MIRRDSQNITPEKIVDAEKRGCKETVIVVSVNNKK
jgi:hypothetical protein